MSLNKFMHPRNKYKHNRPDFEALANKYPEFKQHVVQNDRGKPALDFKNPESVKVLTICLLKEDYGFEIDLPPDRLVPTLPLRLNYVHWIEDITVGWGKKKISAIDIGTGCCCVYPLLAVSANPDWQFLATEADEVNFEYAKKNLEVNKLTEKIKVVKVTDSVILEGVIGGSEDSYDFCMCNPPFFADHFEAQGLVSRTPDRPDAKTMSTASPQESVVQGGEVAFIRKMIEESNFLQGRVRVYSTMLGKKSSLAPLKEILRRNKVTNFATSEFCQGKTMRWGLAWTFDNSVKFPRSEFSQNKKEAKKSIVHVIKTRMGERREHVNNLVCFFRQMFAELKIHCREGKQTQHFALMTLTAAENTWIHSRRKRRQMMRKATQGETVSSESAVSIAEACEVSSTGQGESEATAHALSLSGEFNSSSTSVDEGDASQTGMDTDGGKCISDKGDSQVSSTVGAVDLTETHSGVIEDASSIESSPARQGLKRKIEHKEQQSPNSKLLEGELENPIPDKRSAKIAIGEVKDPKLVEGKPLIEDTNYKRKRDPEQKCLQDHPPPKMRKLEESITSTVTQTMDPALATSSEEGVTEQECPQDHHPPKMRKLEESITSTDPQTKDPALAASSKEGGNAPCANDAAESSRPSPSKETGRERPPSEYILKCHMSVRVQGSDLAVELTWLSGKDIQTMHQLMQVFKNRLEARGKSQ